MSNRKTPNFAYGNFSFQEKGFNMRYQENLWVFPNFPIRKTFDTANIKCNSNLGSREGGKNERN